MACSVDVGDDWALLNLSLGAGAECVVCSGLRFQLGKNDLWTTHPQVAWRILLIRRLVTR